jgi:DNA topoisomerase I
MRPAAMKRKRRSKVESDAEDSSSESDKPLKKKLMKKAPKEESASVSTAKKNGTNEEANGSPKKGKGKKKEKEKEEEDEEVFKWWEADSPEGDGSVKWQTLEHNGVIFPPPYEPLPSNVKMKYNGKSI